jgi:hypothetical protein
MLKNKNNFEIINFIFSLLGQELFRAPSYNYPLLLGVGYNSPFIVAVCLFGFGLSLHLTCIRRPHPQLLFFF